MEGDSAAVLAFFCILLLFKPMQLKQKCGQTSQISTWSKEKKNAKSQVDKTNKNKVKTMQQQKNK